MIKIRGYEIEIDVAEELEPFNLERQEPHGEEIKACSPFRDERNPSFYINTDTGLWKDFGSDSDYHSQGNFIQIMAHLHMMEYAETESYFLEKYNVFIDDVEGIELSINIQMGEKGETYFTREDLSPYLFRQENYLLNRGISAEIQKKFIVGYWKEQKAIALFWRDSYTGRIASVKFRNIFKKQFFYKRGGQPVGKHVFALYDAIQGEHKKVYIVESEIDAMYLWTNGVPAVALGGSSLSDTQRRRLLLSGIETFVIATDNDAAGQKLKNQLEERLSGSAEILEITLPEYAKDINDVRTEDIKKVTDSEESITLDISLHLLV